MRTYGDLKSACLAAAGPILVSIIVASNALAGQVTGDPVDLSSDQDQHAIRTIISEEALAWNRGDAVSFASHVRSDCVFTNTVGMVAVGRTAFEAQHRRIFSDIYKGTHLALTVTHLRFLRPDIAIVDTNADLTGSHWLPPGVKVTRGMMRARLEQVLVKENGSWGITSYHNVFVARDG